MDLTPDLGFLSFVVEERSVLSVGTITEEAGELPGVSVAVVPEIDRSMETRLEIESRNWEL